MTSIRTILHPTDFSDHSARALTLSLELAKQLNAELHLLHVYQLPIYALPDGAMIATPDLVAELSSEAEKRLAELRDSLKTKGIDAKVHSAEGTPHSEIVRVAQEIDAGLIIMGTHGRTGLTRLLMGSVAERVVRTSSVPVMTVP